MNDTRTVIDTNVAVSAVLLLRSVPRLAFDAAVGRGRLLVSEATVAELDEVLRRPKFNNYVSEEKRLEFLAALVQEAELVEVAEVITACRDAKDNKFIGAGRQRRGQPHSQWRCRPARAPCVPGDCHSHAASISREYCGKLSLQKLPLRVMPKRRLGDPAHLW